MSTNDPSVKRFDQQQSVSLSDAIARRKNAPTVIKYESWIEGPRYLAAVLDSGIQSHGLKLLYWRVHKVGWFRVRVVFGVEGAAGRISSFKTALSKFVNDQNESPS